MYIKVIVKYHLQFDFIIMVFNQSFIIQSIMSVPARVKLLIVHYLKV